MRSGEKTEKKKAEKRSALLNAAFQLFTEQGFQKTSISDIANQAEVAKGTFYLYFKDKYHIRTHLITGKAEQIFRQATNGIVFEDPDNVEEVTVMLCSRILDILNENHHIVSFLSKNLSWGVFKKGIEDQTEKGSFDFQGMYHDLLNRSPIRYRDPEIMIFLIIELLGSTSYNSILYNDPVPMNELKPHLLDAIRGIIRSHAM